MNKAQAGILAPVPKLGRHMLFSLLPGADVGTALSKLASAVDGDSEVVGIGHSTVTALHKEIPGLKLFPQFEHTQIEIPATPYALWCWLRGDDRGELFHDSARLNHLIAEAFQCELVIDSFQYGQSRDLTGYEDGTENPTGDAALDAALLRNASPGLESSSFVAIQQWRHQLDYFDSLPSQQQDNIIGRRRSDNEELADAPITAHVKRTAQEDFQPEAFVLRRSMPWAEHLQAGLMFVAFGASFDAFEAQLKRMSGAEDGHVDALFSFSQPLTGSYFWCPPIANKQLDLSALDL